MAGNENEFAGTNDSDDAGAAPSGPIDPATIGGTISGDGFDPAIHVSRDKRNADGTFTRKRGRRAGGSNSSGRGAGQGKASPDLKAATETLSRTLLMLHFGIAGATKSPEMALEKGEADMLAAASVNVLEQFDIRPDPKIEAMIGLIIAAGTVYGPRVYNIRTRVAREKEEHNNSPQRAYDSVVIEMPEARAN